MPPILLKIDRPFGRNICNFYQTVQRHKVQENNILFNYKFSFITILEYREFLLTHYSGRVMQICVFNTVKFGTSASSP